MKRKPIVYILFGVLIASITLLSGITSAIARPASTPKPVDVNVERFSFQNLNHEDTDRIYYTDRFYLAMLRQTGTSFMRAITLIWPSPIKWCFPLKAPPGISTSTEKMARQ